MWSIHKITSVLFYCIAHVYVNKILYTFFYFCPFPSFLGQLWCEILCMCTSSIQCSKTYEVLLFLYFCKLYILYICRKTSFEIITHPSPLDKAVKRIKHRQSVLYLIQLQAQAILPDEEAEIFNKANVVCLDT